MAENILYREKITYFKMREKMITIKKIKNIFIGFCTLLIITYPAQAGTRMGGYKYFDLGGIYTNTNFPVDVSANQNFEKPDLSNLKSGTSTSHNILHLVDVGDSSIDMAAKKGGITKIHYVDTNIHKLFIPLIFIPIYVREQKTIVYGE